MLVSICIITYQRPEGLKQLIASLDRLEFKQIELPEIEVIVIDNDVTVAVCDFCEQIESFKWSLICEIEPQRGISYARNHAFSCASKQADFIVTIDDDEVADPQWLEQLLMVQQKYDADVVAGPVFTRFLDKDVPNWVQQGQFFDLTRYPTGHLIQVAFTNNSLVRGEILRKLGKPFDERFALTGGEDSHLFMRLYQAGAKMVWADEAIVYESIPQTRTTKKYILERGYRSWCTHSLLERELYPSVKIQAIRTIKGMGLIVIGLVQLIPSLFQGQHVFVLALRSIYRGCGTIAGLIGRHETQYYK